MIIKPIHSESDHREALAQLEERWDVEAGTPAGDEFEVLATLVDDYERKTHPILPPDPIEAIKFRLEQQGQTRKVLEPILGTRARVSEILNGKRRLTLSMIRALNRQFQIPLEILVAEPVAKTKRGGRGKRSAGRAA